MATELTRRQQSELARLLEKEDYDRLQGPLISAGGDPDELMNILGQDPEALQGNFFERMYSYVTGKNKAEFGEVPELTERKMWEAGGGDPEAFVYGGGDSRFSPQELTRYSLGKLTTEDDDQLEGILRETLGHDAGVDFWRDKFNNTVITIDGADFYLNKPGLSMTDLDRLGGQIASYSLGSRFYAYGNMIKRMVGSALAFTGIATARDVGSWTLGGPMPQPENSVLIGGLGALGVPVLALGGLVTRAVYNRARAWFKGGSLSPEAIKELERAGIDVTEMEPMLRKWYNQMEREYGTAGAVAETVARTLPDDLVVPLTAGEKSQRLATQQKEYILEGGAKGTAAQRVGEEFRERQARELDTSVGIVTGNVQRDTALSTTLKELGIISARDHQAFKMAFGNAEKNLAFLPVTERQTLRNQVGFVSEGGTLEATESYALHMSALDDILSGAQRARPGPKGALPEVTVAGEFSGPSVSSLFQWRSEVSAAANAASGSEGMALSSMLRNFDDYIDDLITKGNVLGKPETIGFWKSAVELRRKFGKKWQATKREDPNFLASQMVNSQGQIKLMPDEAANVILNTSTTGWMSKQFLNRNLLEVKKRLGSDSAGWRGIRDEVVLRLIQNARNKAGEFQAKTMLGNWMKLKRENPGLLNTIFDITDQQMLSRFLYNSARIMAKKPMGHNPPNSALFQTILGRAANIPLINVLRDVGAVNQAHKLLGRGQMEKVVGKSTYPGKALPEMITSQGAIQAEPYVTQKYPNLGAGMTGLLAQPFVDDDIGLGNRGGDSGL